MRARSSQTKTRSGRRTHRWGSDFLVFVRKTASLPSLTAPAPGPTVARVISEQTHLDAARAGDDAAFRQLVDPHRRGLLAHCYRMCGSIQEAEDVVQEAMLRAWNGLSTFESRSSFRGWIYRIATNAALDALRRAKVRCLPPMLVAAARPDAALVPAPTEPVWLEPYPDALLPDEASSPDAALSQRQSVSFAFLQALQRLPAAQRAALLLKDVVGSSASEVAELLDTSVPAVNSLLQRARTTLGTAPPPEPADPDEAHVVQTYVRAFESANVDVLVRLLRDDARMSMPPTPSWYQGRDAICDWLGHNVLTSDAAGRFHGTRTRANGSPAVLMFGPDGALFGVHVLTLAGGRIDEICAFMQPSVLRFFESPAGRDGSSNP